MWCPWWTTRSIRGEVTAIRTEVHGLDVGLRSEIDGAETRLNVHIDRVEVSADARFDGLEARMNGRIDRVESRLNACVDRAKSDLADRIVALDRNARGLSDRVAGTNEWVDGLYFMVGRPQLQVVRAGHVHSAVKGNLDGQ